MGTVWATPQTPYPGLIDLNSEKKIDRIEERLSGIETVLDALLSKLDNLDMNSRNGSPPKHSQGGPSPLPHDAKEPEIIFEGSTALNSHSEFARNVLERAVVNTPSMNMNPELKDALTNLQNIVNRQNMPTSFESRVLLNPAAFDNSTTPLERPPWEIVEAVLTQAIGAYPLETTPLYQSVSLL